jgi:hypothetical protein
MGVELLLFGFLVVFFGWLGLVLWSLVGLCLGELRDERSRPHPDS